MVIEYKKGNIYYTIEGQGPTIVLLHGFLENVAMWTNLVSDFSDKYEVICIDLLGHGKTDCLGYVHTMEDMAEAVFAVLSQHNIEKAHVIGHSMGGYVALAMAEKKPHLFSGLCLMNSTFEADNKDRKLIRTRANKMAQTNFETLVRMSFTNLFAEESRDKFKTEFNEALQLALKTSLQGYIAAQEGMKKRKDRLEVFKNINGNKLIIIGKKDSVINSESILSNIRNTSINFVEFSEGHMSHIENKSELSYFLKQFVEK